MRRYDPVMIRDNFENNKCYNIPRAQLIIADIPYNIGNYAYGSNPSWYKGGDNRNGENELADKSFFDRDGVHGSESAALLLKDIGSRAEMHDQGGKGTHE